MTFFPRIAFVNNFKDKYRVRGRAVQDSDKHFKIDDKHNNAALSPSGFQGIVSIMMAIIRDNFTLVKCGTGCRKLDSELISSKEKINSNIKWTKKLSCDTIALCTKSQKNPIGSQLTMECYRVRNAEMYIAQVSRGKNFVSFSAFFYGHF